MKIAPPKLYPVEAVQPSTYNPRQADPMRLDLIELSLRKLGFLLPLYADKNGELLSGHQRHHVSTRMGAQQIPICFFNQEIALNERKAINIMFNRGTNDMDVQDTSQQLTQALQSSDIFKIAEQLPDLKPDTPEFYPCLHTQMMDIKPLLQANRGQWVQYASNMASVMRGKGIIMPLVITPSYKVVNGIGRLQYWAENEAKQVEVIVVSELQAQFAHAMLNWLSMDFDIKARYGDYLRHNSFRRARVVVPNNHLGYGFTFVVHPQQHPNTFKLDNLKQRKAWEKQHGTCVLDFGAGRLKEVKNLRRFGIEADAFEPYHMKPEDGDKINKPASLELNRQFLAAVASGKQWSSIFISAVLNSVPFYEDRVHVIRILAALCNEGCKVYGSANADTQAGWQHYLGRGVLNHTTGKAHGFALAYEEGVKLGDLTTGSPKAQKFHSLQEFYDLFALFFDEVRVDYYLGNVVTAIAWNPKPVIPAALAESLEFEMELPYPDESRMGLSGEAKAAFGQRLKMQL